jgi:hypothetical protein
MAKRKQVASVIRQAAIHDDLQVALDLLLNTAMKHGVHVAGFIYGSQPTLYNFGTSKEAEELSTYEKLTRMASRSRAAGVVMNMKPRKPC